MDEQQKPIQGPAPVAYITVRFPVLVLADDTDSKWKTLPMVIDKVTEQAKAFPGGPFTGMRYIDERQHRQILYYTAPGEVLAVEDLRGET